MLMCEFVCVFHPYTVFACTSCWVTSVLTATQLSAAESGFSCASEPLPFAEARDQPLPACLPAWLFGAMAGGLREADTRFYRCMFDWSIGASVLSAFCCSLAVLSFLVAEFVCPDVHSTAYCSFNTDTVGCTIHNTAQCLLPIHRIRL